MTMRYELSVANVTPPKEEYFDLEMDTVDLHRDQLMSTFAAIYMVLAVCGVLLNILVLLRLLALRIRRSDQFFDGCALPLTLMAIADLFSLFAIIVLAKFTYGSSDGRRSGGLATIMCKGTIFVLHASNSASRWCWLFASGLRYVAVYHPMWHRRQWRLGQRTLPIIIIVSVVMNSWLLITVESNPPHCTEAPLSHEHGVNRWLHVIEMTWSYWVPVCIMTVLDVRVMFLKPPRMSMPQCDHENSGLSSRASLNSERMLIALATRRKRNRSRSQSQMAVYQWLLITSINLLLNAPDVVLRVAIMLDAEVSTSILFHPTFTLTSRLLYFTQFCINASYLSVVVFRGNTNSNGDNKGRMKKRSVFSAFAASLQMYALHSEISESHSLQRLESCSVVETEQL